VRKFKLSMEYLSKTIPRETFSLIKREGISTSGKLFIRILFLLFCFPMIESEFSELIVIFAEFS